MLPFDSNPPLSCDACRYQKTRDESTGVGGASEASGSSREAPGSSRSGEGTCCCTCSQTSECPGLCVGVRLWIARSSPTEARSGQSPEGHESDRRRQTRHYLDVCLCELGADRCVL